MKRTEHQNLLWSITNNMYNGFIIKKLVHETRNATACVGNLPGNKGRLDCVCLISGKSTDTPLKKICATSRIIIFIVNFKFDLDLDVYMVEVI